MFLRTPRYLVFWGFVPSFIVDYLDARTTRLMRCGAPFSTVLRAQSLGFWAARHRFGFRVIRRD